MYLDEILIFYITILIYCLLHLSNSYETTDLLRVSLHVSFIAFNS